MEFLLRHTPLLYFTQSLWRDEAFSILAAERPLATILPKLTFEPPLYYTLLHFWMKLFGRSEISARALSLLGFCLALVVIVIWAEKVFKKHWLSWFTPLLFFLNPMLLYYAFEVRTYGWYMFFGALSFYAYLNKRWILYIVAAIGGFYTHTYMIIFLFAQGLLWLSDNWKHVTKDQFAFFKKDAGARAYIAILLAISPWIVRVIAESAKLKSSWYFPVDFHLIRSVLGNMFLGYEGTPGYLWNTTALISLLLLGLFLLALRSKTTRPHVRFLLAMVFGPLALVIGVSFIKPLFVNRYLIPVTVSEVMLVSLALAAIKNVRLQKVCAAGVLFFLVGFNLWYPDKHAKLPIRDTIVQINALRAPQDVTIATSPLIFFETLYYSADPTKVFLYNPNGGAFPWYVGDAIVSPGQMVRDFPPYPIKAFLVNENGSYEMAYHLQFTTHSLRTKP